MITNIIAYSLLILSWFLPERIHKNDENKGKKLRTIMASIALGMFISNLINIFEKHI